MGRGCPEIIHLSQNVPGLSQNGPVCPKMQAADQPRADRLPRSIGEIAVRPIGNRLPIGLTSTTSVETERVTTLVASRSGHQSLIMKVWNQVALVHLVDDHGQVVCNDAAQHLITLCHDIARIEAVSEQPL